MITLSPIVKQLIEDNIDLITNNAFEEFYTNVLSLNDSEVTCQVTEALLTASIDPLPYMKRIPTGYLRTSGMDIDTLTIPGNIKTVSAHSFTGSCLRKVILEEGVESIETRAFSSCTLLEEVDLPSSINYLSNSIFSRSRNLKRIFYNGTKQKFDSVDKYDNWISAPRNITVELICKDGSMIVS